MCMHSISKQDMYVPHNHFQRLLKNGCGFRSTRFCERCINKVMRIFSRKLRLNLHILAYLLSSQLWRTNTELIIFRYNVIYSLYSTFQFYILSQFLPFFVLIEQILVFHLSQNQDTRVLVTVCIPCISFLFISQFPFQTEHVHTCPRH